MKRFSGLATFIAGLGLLAGIIIGHTTRRDSEAQPAISARREPASATPTPRKPRVPRLSLDRARVQNGKLIQEVDAQRVVYSIDPAIQAKAEAFLGRYELPFAGMVLYELDSGAVRVMTGWSQASTGKRQSQLAIRVWAPAASIYKLVSAAALLSRGVSPKTKICYHGGSQGITAEHLRYRPRRDRTCATFSDAIAHSINPVIGRLATTHLSRKRMITWAERFGFNRSIPFDLPVERSSAEIPKDRLELARTAAGFWHTELSPLHGAVIAGTVASGGILRWPYVIESVHAIGKTNSPSERAAKRKLHAGGRRAYRRKAVRILSKRSATQLTKMMARTTTIGSARRGFRSRRGKPYLGAIKVAGKTGSLSRRAPELEVHYSWFVGFAPVNKPKVAVAVLLGNPAKWRVKATTAARYLLSYYFSQVAVRSKRPSTI